MPQRVDPSRLSPYSSCVRNTPVTWPRAELSGGVPSTGRRFALLMGGNELALSRGELLLGRSRSCQVIVEDMLVSRHHARLLVSKVALFVEDLGSTNGVIVNEVPISGPTPLHDGDRIIVGTQELVVRAVDDGIETLEPPSPRVSQPTPKAQPSVQLAAVVTRQQPTQPEVPAQVTVPMVRAPEPSVYPSEGGATTQRTEKADGLLTMARMADRMIAMGRHDAAARLLGDHLKGVLAKAKQGRVVPRDVLDTVGVYGLKLSEVTHDATWANLAIELHSMARRPLPERAVGILELLLLRLPELDRQLLLRFKAALRDAADNLSREEWTLVERILKMPTR